MTVASTTQKVTYQGNGATTSFAIPFSFFSTASNIVVYLREESTTPDTETLQTNPAEYSIVGTNVVMVTAPSATQKLLIKRVLPLTQLLDYLQNVDFPIQDHEDALDKLVMITQQLAEIIGRSSKLPHSSSINDLYLPEPSPGELIAWNAGGTALMNANAGNLGFLTALLAQDSMTIANGQGAQADITDLLFDGALITSVIVFYELTRVTSLENRFTNGVLYLRYKNSSWETEEGLTVGDFSGVNFSIVTTGSNGQVKYTSSNIPGAGYAGTMKWRTITFS